MKNIYNTGNTFNMFWGAENMDDLRKIEDIEENDWSDDIILLPSISWRDVTTYLIDTPSKFTNES